MREKTPHPGASAGVHRATDRERQPNIRARLVIGFLRILLVAENWGPHDHWTLDWFPLNDPDDTDLLQGIEELRTVGYGSYARPIELSPAVFSPLGSIDPEACDAMERLGHRGLAVSSDVTRITHPLFLKSADGPRRHWPQIRRRLRAAARMPAKTKVLD